MSVSIGGHLVAQELARAGVRDVFTLCGGHIAPIYDGCLREGIRLIDTRHEQAAAHAADAYGRLTRAPGVAIVTAGPGVTDAITGIANAFQAQAPLVVLGGAAELRSAGRGALQEMEQLPLVRSITKWCATVTDPRRLREQTQTALRLAVTGIPGPTFLELPFDVLTAQVEAPLEPPPLPGPVHSMADPEAVARAAALLEQAERPVAFVGSQLWWDDAAAALRALCEEIGLPVVMNAMGRGALPAGHPLALNHARKLAFRQTDVCLVVGTPLDFRVGFGAGIHPSARLIQLDRDSTQFNKVRAAEVALCGHARLVLQQLQTALQGEAARRMQERTKPWCAALRAEEQKRQAELDGYIRATSRPINHYQLAAGLAEALGSQQGGPIDPDVVLIGDGGDVVALGAKVLPLRQPGQWLDPGPLGCLGVGAPFALAAKALEDRDGRQRRVVVLSGDGSFGLNGFDFETCVRFGFKVTVVVGNDAAWGQIRGPQIMLFGAERAPATKLAPVRYDRVVEALGGSGYHVDDPADLVPTLRRALEDPQVACVNVTLDPDFVVRSGAAKLTV
ncbi:MAG: thiamine pyrophosphate-binding protein [Myxococcales bacterium]|nr:thiamine pyrophosphate-binding protein [Myxococcota bacterium]MDW8282397.1 thiamine pyrophosphate-binding protein [Myxococcales bacterium]